MKLCLHFFFTPASIKVLLPGEAVSPHNVPLEKGTFVFPENRTARILFRNQPAGTLTETAGGGTRLVYDAGQTAPIACCFPIHLREHDWAAGLHPFFEHLAPEGWLRERQARVAHIAEEDDFGLLLRYGEDCIGAVSIARLDPNGAAVPEPADGLTQAATRGARTLSGIQPKLLVNRLARNRFQPAGATGPAAFIAKFNSDGRPDLVRNELLSLKWSAAVLGAEQVTRFEHGLVELGRAAPETALVVERFDRTAAGEKLRLEDCAQILVKPRGRDYAGKYDAAYEQVAAIIAAHSVRPQIDLDRFFRRVALFAILGNCDGHLKNFSLLETPDGLRLSPAYDILNTAIYPDLSPDFGLRFGDRRLALEQVDRRVLEEFGRAIGLPEKAVELALADIARGVKRAARFIAPPAGEDAAGFVTRYAEIVRNGCRRIFGTE